MSTRATMCLVNLTGEEITAVQVSNASGFEKPERDLAFLTGKINAYGSLCGYVELESMAPTYTILVTFSGGSLEFTDEQGHNWDDKWAGDINSTGTPGYEVWRTLGGNVSKSAGTNGIYIRRSQAPDNSTWMADLLSVKPTIKLCDLVMPGSHDAGMWTGAGDKSKTQRLSILGQLQAGSRYFDIRTCLSLSGEVWTYHGTEWGDSLTNILSDVETFLKGAGSKELVILKFSHAYENSKAPTVAQVKKFNATLLYKGSPVNPVDVPLADLQGKLLAVFGDDNSSFKSFWDPSTGIFPYHDIPVKQSLPVPVDPVGLSVYDNFANDHTYEDMFADQSPKLAQYGGWGFKYLFLLSWTVTGGDGTYDIEVLADTAGPWLPRTLVDMTSTLSTRACIVYLDFIDPHLCKAVIDVNRHPLYKGPVAGALTCVSVGRDGTVWGVNIKNVSSKIWRWGKFGWEPVAGTLTQVAVGSAAEVWGLNDGSISKWDGTGWAPVSGPKLSWISAAGDGSVWGLSAAGEIFRRSAGVWETVGGPANAVLTRISVGNSTQVWGVDGKSGTSFRWSAKPPAWTPVTVPKLSDVSVADDGSLWGVGATNKKAYVWRGKTFMPAAYSNIGGQPGGPDMTQIAAGSSAQVWAVDSDNGGIYQWS
jgi:hypothetical protein